MCGGVSRKVVDKAHERHRAIVDRGHYPARYNYLELCEDIDSKTLLIVALALVILRPCFGPLLQAELLRRKPYIKVSIVPTESPCRRQQVVTRQ